MSDNRRAAIPVLFARVVVIGVGLIGGSFALALRRAGAVRHIAGIGRSSATVARAVELGVIDEAGAGPESVRGADLVLISVPVGQMAGVMSAIAPHLGPGTVVTDAGSNKQSVVADARKALHRSIGRFVPGHPIAGTEHSGVEAATESLYRDRRVILTPIEQTEPGAIAIVERAWAACGARVQRMAPHEHDEILAAVSHLPHLLAFALVDQVATDPRADRLFELAAGGFRDFTRIASSHPEMWRDICIANRAALVTELGRYQEHLGKLRAMLQRADAQAIEALFERARAARNRWLDSLG